jgi:WhiB family redox-sensing transcriptional regulator
MVEGACRILRIDHRLFFQVIGRHQDITVTAKRVCDSCHVREECLEYALSNGIADGIWGGLTKQERKRIRRERIMLARPA